MSAPREIWACGRCRCWRDAEEIVVNFGLCDECLAEGCPCGEARPESCPLHGPRGDVALSLPERAA